MIILPDRNIPRAKFLIPIPKHHWREPSCSIPRDWCGNLGSITRFRIDAKTHDGVLIWRGWFDDREDFDAFLWAMATGSIQYEKPLWNLPIPNYQGLEPGLIYKFYTTSFYTSPTGSNQTYSKPVDWNSNDNYIELIGGGGSGARSNAGAGEASGTGGGGGAYSRSDNIFLSGDVYYRIGSGGNAVYYTAGGTGNAVQGNPGGDSWFNGTSMPTGSPNDNCGAKGGGGGVGTYNNNNGTNVDGGAGGLASSSVGDTKYDGGTGGNITVNNRSASGGGGAAGMYGAGNTAPAVTGSDTYGSGAKGDLGYGGTAGTGGGAGGAGTEWDASHGSGGSGSGYFTTTSGAKFAGDGGLYGSGGGGIATINGSYGESGNGRSGIVVVNYTPLKLTGFNMPMLGM